MTVIINGIRYAPAVDLSHAGDRINAARELLRLLIDCDDIDARGYARQALRYLVPADLWEVARQRPTVALRMLDALSEQFTASPEQS